MCAIFGVIARNRSRRVIETLAYIYSASHERGRDGRGFDVFSMDQPVHHFRDITRSFAQDLPPLPASNSAFKLIGNLRAEPTTEFVSEKTMYDQQPYYTENWTIVHNGTIANDKELRRDRIIYPSRVDSAAIVERLQYNSDRTGDYYFDTFTETIREIKGSFAILAAGDEVGCIYAACNYRPIWYAVTPDGVFFTSSRDYLPPDLVPQMLTPYSIAKFTVDGLQLRIPLLKTEPTNRAMVVCSGGMDSVVAATFAQKELDLDITLVHFKYGSRAEGPEVKAVQAIAEFLHVPVVFIDVPIYNKSDSPLLDPDSTVAGGEAGAEFAHEWVPARNLMMLSITTALAEAKGCDTIVLGTNLEEAGAYPDNEPEFINRFNDMVPFAVGDGKSIQVIMPVGNMMKHEIVRLGLSIGAPLHLTWSCYKALKVEFNQADGGKFRYIHCGTCGPCYMRKTAFLINNTPEVIKYDV